MPFHPDDFDDDLFSSAEAKQHLFDMVAGSEIPAQDLMTMLLLMQLARDVRKAVRLLERSVP